MKFRVTGISNIVCCGCGGTTNVAPKRIYKVEDLTCNCEPHEEAMKFEVTHISDIVMIDTNETTRVVPDGVYAIDEDGNIQEINNANMDMFEEPYHQFTKTACIEVVGQDGEGNVLVQNVGDSSDRWVIPSEIFSETYEGVEIPPAADNLIGDEETHGRVPTEDDTDGADTDGADDENVTQDDVSGDGETQEPEQNGAATDEKQTKPVQTEMFVEPPENVINPNDSDMSEDDVRKYLKGLGWQELLEAAKNNEVIKPPKAKREELEELIIQKVFHEQVSESN